MKLQGRLMVAVVFLVTVGLVAWSAPAPWNGSGPQQKSDEQAQKDKEKEEPQTQADKAKQEEMEKACASLDTPYKTETDKTQHPMPEAPADKALIYVVRPTMFGNKVQTKLAVDGQFKGINRGNNYFFFTLEPGTHTFCSQAENKSALSLKVEAGKTYYLQQQIKMGFMKARTKLASISEAEGKEALGKCQPSTWEVKK